MNLRKGGFDCGPSRKARYPLILSDLVDLLGRLFDLYFILRDFLMFDEVRSYDDGKLTPTWLFVPSRPRPLVGQRLGEIVLLQIISPLTFGDDDLIATRSCR